MNARHSFAVAAGMNIAGAVEPGYRRELAAIQESAGAATRF